MTSIQNKDAIIASFMKNWQFENFPPILKGLIERGRNIDKLRIKCEYPIGVYCKVVKPKSLISEFFSTFFVMSYTEEELKKMGYI